MNDFTVYYVVGQPRTGSTFVGDRIARLNGIVNAGEVWQTFRSVGLVEQPGFEGSPAPWARPKAREKKNEAIRSDAFWRGVLALAEKTEPYRALVEHAGTVAYALVDCSKTDRGIERYLDIGCKVVVIHTTRAFGSWAASVRKHAIRNQLPVPKKWRLLLAYIRLNRRFRQRWMAYDYLTMAQEDLAMADEILAALPKPKNGSDHEYLNAEMFGTPGFSGTYEPNRSTLQVTFMDRIYSKLAGTSHRRAQAR